MAEVITDPAGPQAALVALDEDGAIRAHVGSRDYETLKVDLARGVDGGGSGRQPGSTFKPFVLQAALAGRRDPRPIASPAPPQIEVDVGGTPFPVENYGGSGFGELTRGRRHQAVGEHRLRAARRRGRSVGGRRRGPRGGHRRRARRGAVDRARRGGGQPAGPGQRLPHLRQRRHPGRALRHRPDRGRRRQRASGSRDGPEPEEDAVDPDVARTVTAGPPRRDRVGHRAGGRHRPPGRRQDRHHAGQRRRLVRRLRARLRRGGVGRPPGAHADGRRDRRRPPGPDLAAVHGGGHGGPRGRGLPRPARGPAASRSRRQHHQLLVEQQLVDVVDPTDRPSSTAGTDEPVTTTTVPELGLDHHDDRARRRPRRPWPPRWRSLPSELGRSASADAVSGPGRRRRPPRPAGRGSGPSRGCGRRRRRRAARGARGAASVLEPRGAG